MPGHGLARRAVAPGSARNDVSWSGSRSRSRDWGPGAPPSAALAKALADIDRWRRHAPHFILKRLARDALELGAEDVRVRVRYGARAQALAPGSPPRTLDLGGAIIACERAYRRERAAAESAETLWAIRRPRLDLMILCELRLLLRFLRRRAPHRFGEILGAVAEE